MAGRHYIAVGIVLVGCGGAAPEPAAPESAAPEPEAAAVETVEPEAAPEAAETEPESAAPEPAAPEKQSLSKEELTLVLQQLLDDPDLEQYLHLDKAGRLPLKISGADLPEKLAAHKGGYDAAAFWARSRAVIGSDSPNQTTPGRINLPHLGQFGAISGPAEISDSGPR